MKTKEELSKISKEYYKNNKTKCKKYSMEYYKKNKTKINKQTNEYYYNHREDIILKHTKRIKLSREKDKLIKKILLDEFIKKAKSGK